MADPHYEDDAQAWHSILETEFTDAYDPTVTSPLRFYLSQPSPHWRRYELRELVRYGHKSVAQNPPSPIDVNCEGMLKSSLFGLADRNVRNVLLLQQQSQHIVNNIETFESSDTVSNNPASCLAFDRGPMVHVSIEHSLASKRHVT